MCHVMNDIFSVMVAACAPVYTRLSEVSLTLAGRTWNDG